MMLHWGFAGCGQLPHTCSRAWSSPVFGKGAWAGDAASSSSSCSSKAWEDVGCGVQHMGYMTRGAGLRV